MDIDQRIFTISGNEIWTESLGDKSHPSILLISGAGAHALFWTDFFCEVLVNGGFQVIRYDHRDVGYSSGVDYARHPYQINDLAEDAALILDAYSIDSAHIIGHSMGGYVAQVFATFFPEKTLSLTCIAAGPAGAIPNVELSEEEQAVIDTTKEINSGNKPTPNFQDSLPGFMRMWKRWQGTLPMDTDLAIQYTKEIYDRTQHPIGMRLEHPHILAVRASLNDQSKKEIKLDKIQVPMLIIQGEEDYLLLPKRGGIALWKLFPHAQLRLIPDMGHMYFNRIFQIELANEIVEFLHSIG